MDNILKDIKKLDEKTVHIEKTHITLENTLNETVKECNILKSINDRLSSELKDIKKTLNNIEGQDKALLIEYINRDDKNQEIIDELKAEIEFLKTNCVDLNIRLKQTKENLKLMNGHNERLSEELKNNKRVLKIKEEQDKELDLIKRYIDEIHTKRDLIEYYA